jgi:hypothetical protein
VEGKGKKLKWDLKRNTRPSQLSEHAESYTITALNNDQTKDLIDVKID